MINFDKSYKRYRTRSLISMMSQWGSDESINISCSQPILIHCDFVDKLRKLVHTDNYAPQLRRERGLNDDN